MENKENIKKKVVVIGGGPGGYEAAISAAKQGADVTLIEKDYLGGTCLNRGCIPTKAFLAGAMTVQNIKEAKKFGITAESVSVDFAELYKHKEAVVKKLRNGIQFLMRNNSIRVIEAEASFLSSKRICAKSKDGNEVIDADVIIIASGSEPAMPPIPGIDGNHVIDSTAALAMQTLPSKMVIIGGGVIGVELSAIYRGLGVDVTILEACPQILPEMDEDIVSEYMRISGIGDTVKTGCRVKCIKDSVNGKLVEYVDTDGSDVEVECEIVLVATGRRAYTKGLGLEKAGISTDRGAVCVDDHFETNVPGVFAIGDVNGKTQLAHAASAQGIWAASFALTRKSYMKTEPVPWCVFTEPEIAGVGLSEKKAKKEEIDYQTVQYSFGVNGKALAMGQPNGFVKILYSPRYQEVLGAEIVGAHATDLIGELSLGMSLEVTLEELAGTVHAHPTLAEIIMEAAKQKLE